MSIWTIMNGVAWALCALFAYLILSDLIKVEREKRAEHKNSENAGNNVGKQARRAAGSVECENTDGPAK